MLWSDTEVESVWSMNAFTTKHRSTSVSTIQISLDYKEENYTYLKCSQWLLETVHTYKITPEYLQ